MAIAEKRRTHFLKHMHSHTHTHTRKRRHFPHLYTHIYVQ